MYGANPPTAISNPAEILSLEESWMTSSGVIAPDSTNLTRYFSFRTLEDTERSWNIPTSNDLKFYGCFDSGERPTAW